MIEYTQGNILDAQVEALVNTVNCVGIMGRGIALQFKNRFPANFKAYAAACKNEEVEPGRMFVFDTQELVLPRYIINFPTKRHWRGKSRIEDLVSGLDELVKVVRDRKIKSIAIPPLGAGLGGLEWQEVKPLIKSAMSQLDKVEVVVYEPSEDYKDTRVNKSTKVPDMTPGRAALVSLMTRYLEGLMDPGISLLEVHKLMYFLQEAGEPLKLKFVQANYGPYAENLRHVLKDIEGHYVSGYFDGGDEPRKQLNLVPGAVDEAKRFLLDKTETQIRFDRVSRLVSGFETPYGLELLSTVHWVIEEQGKEDIDAIREAIYSWNPGKHQFTPAQITLATEHLASQDWVPINASPT